MRIRFNRYNTLHPLIWLFVLFVLPVPVASQTCTEIDLAQIPLEAIAPSPAPANVVFLLDDSISMDDEILVADPDPTFFRKYLFDNAGDNASYLDRDYFDQTDRKLWRYQWHGYNRLYYNPAVAYGRWPDPDNPDQPQAPADLDHPLSNPFTDAGHTQDLDAVYTEVSEEFEVDDKSPVDADDPGSVSMTGVWSSNDTEHFTTRSNATFTWSTTLPRAGLWSVWVFNKGGNLDDQARYRITHAGGNSTVTINQNDAKLVSLGEYTFASSAQVRLTRTNSNTNEFTSADRVIFIRSEGAITIPVAHYYLRTVEGTTYLVMLDGEHSYFRVDDQAEGQTGHGIVAHDELVEVPGLPSEIDPCLTYADDRQNFANWFTYHRKRSLAATYAVANVIAGFEKHPPNSCAGSSSEPEPVEGLKEVQVGFSTLNNTLQQSVLPVKVEIGDETLDETQAVLEALYTYATEIEFGQNTYLRSGLDCVGRYYSSDLSCSDLGDSPMASEAEGGACQKHYAVIVTDGAYSPESLSGIGNQDGDQGVPYADEHSDTLADVAMKYYKDEGDLSSDHDGIQRMHTFAVGLGVEGSLDRDSYPASWPEPVDPATKIDDLWHATVNGRGDYYQSGSPEEMAEGLQAIKEALLPFSGTSAPVSATGEAVASDNTVFVPEYESEFWTGDLKAYTLSDSGATSLKWSAASQLEGVSADDRNIYTYNGTSGVEFLFGQELPGSLTENEINYLRGDQSKEQENGGLFRNRNSLLGDIVHSSPAYRDDTVYVGANDGMLHAFDSENGSELFAYIPNIVYSNLSKLTDALYGDTVSHSFYVDLTPTVAKMNGTTYLVGGLGGGGKGYFCLDVTSPSVFNEDDVLWEFPDAGTSEVDIDDMGFSFSRAMIVKTRTGPKVLFGNGYNSTNGHAVLFILDPATGDVDKKIDTGAGGSECNGLSTPVVIDVDNDDIGDYAYAGDLQGNLWRFDLTDASPNNWKVEKLFQAKRSNGDEQSITTQPDAMFHCTGGANGVLVTFGTGRYLGAADIDIDADPTLNNDVTHSLYGIWDLDGVWNSAATAHNWGTVNHGTGALTGSRSGFSDELLEQEVIGTVTDGGKSYRVVSDNPIYWKLSAKDALPASHGGYFLDLPASGERMIADTAIRDFRLIAVSMLPSPEPCINQSTSFVHLFNACSGGRDPLPQIDVDGDDQITSSDTVASSSAGDVPASGVEIEGPVRQPLVLRELNNDGAQTERLVFPQAFTGGGGVGGGSTGVVTVRPERRGNYYWREVR